MNGFAEDVLPDEQSPIVTRNLTRFRSFMRLITDGSRGYPTMGIVTGGAGLGKTIAVDTYLTNLSPRDHTGLPAAVAIKVKPRSTSKALANDIVSALHDIPRGRNVYEVADEAADAMIRNDLELLIVDEADRLNEDSFDVLRHIHDKTGCSVVVVGLPSLLRVIDVQEKFASRIALRMQFEPSTLDEVLTKIMPQLVFPYWRFDPENADDLALGEHIWNAVSPSLRKLRNLLQAASQIAATQPTDNKRITRADIDVALEFTANEADKKRQKRKKQQPAADTHEGRSRQRQEARKPRASNAKSI